VPTVPPSAPTLPGRKLPARTGGLGFSLRTRKLAVISGAAALFLGIAVAFMLKSPSTAKASASVSPPEPAPPSPSAPSLPQPAAPPVRAAVAEAPPREAPPPAADPPATDPPATAPPAADLAAADPPVTDPPASHRRTKHAKRKSAVAVAGAHHGKRHQRHEVRGTKAARHRALAKHTTAGAAAADGADPRATYERGNALLFAGNAAGAVAAYREAVRLAPADPIGYRGLGLAYEQTGDTAAAVRALQKYLKLAPSAPDRAIISRRIERLGKSASSN
jgi:hypothetical protein